MIPGRRGSGIQTHYFTTMRTTLIAITLLIVVAILFLTTKAHVIVHLYPKFQKSIKSRRFVFANFPILYDSHLPLCKHLWNDKGLKPISGSETPKIVIRPLRRPHVSPLASWGARGQRKRGRCGAAMAAVIINKKRAAKKKKQQGGVHDAPALIYVSLSLPFPVHIM